MNETKTVMRRANLWQRNQRKAQKEADKGAREVARLAQLDALPYPEINRRLFVFVLG